MRERFTTGDKAFLIRKPVTSLSSKLTSECVGTFQRKHVSGLSLEPIQNNLLPWATMRVPKS